MTLARAHCREETPDERRQNMAKPKGRVYNRAAFSGVASMKKTWTPESWRRKPAQQMPVYEDPPSAWPMVETQLASFPPLVFAGEASKP